MVVRKVIGVGVFLVMAAVNCGLAADVRVQVGDVKDNRSTGQFFARLEVELKFLGDDIEGAKGLRFTVAKAVDDTGKNLIKEDKDSERNEFSHFGRLDQVIIQLKNPSRKAMAVKTIVGDLEIFRPDKDPASTIGVKDIAGKPKISLTHPSLKAAQIQMTVYSKEQYDKDAKAEQKASEAKAGKDAMSEGIGKAFSGMFGGMMDGSKNSVIIKVKDPQSKLIGIDFLDASGKVLHPNQTMTMGEVRSYDFSEPLPKGAQLRVYVLTPKSIIKAPVTVKDIALP